jgi:class 3 adenylate cyclase
VEGSKAGRVYATGEILVEKSVAFDRDHFQRVDQETNYRTDSMVCVPLTIGSERLGVVQLLNKTSGEYTARDALLLEHFAAHAAVVIRNARHIRDLLAHKGLFASPTKGQKAADLLRQLAAPAHRERMTILFADMRGFTRLSQTLGDPLEIERHLNQFLSLLSSAAVEHEGLVNKFLGDGMLALFRGAKSEVRAIRCAFTIVERFRELRIQWNQNRNEDLGFLDIGAGIVTGEVIIGSIGGGRLKDFTVLGNAVNLAAAFQDAARNGQRVLVDQSTLSAVKDIVAEVDDPVSYELRKPDQPSGITYKRYNVRRLRPAVEPTVTVANRAQLASEQVKGLQSYYSGSWAVIVGVDQYQSPHVGRLGYAVADAHAVAEALPRVGFPAERIQVLENAKATKDAIQRAIYGKLATTQRDDRLLVFFALHGEVVKHPKGEQGYLLPFDADPTNLPLTALPMSELAQIGRRLHPKHILFVLDTCFSGFAARRGPVGASDQVDLDVLTREPVVQLLTAGTGDQKAVEDGGHGIFTRHFLKGIDGWADRDGTGLTALKLAVYVQERVVADSSSRQTPQYAKLDGEGEFLFLPPQK